MKDGAYLAAHLVYGAQLLGALLEVPDQMIQPIGHPVEGLGHYPHLVPIDDESPAREVTGGDLARGLGQLPHRAGDGAGQENGGEDGESHGQDGRPGHRGQHEPRAGQRL
jgi:hypothetical protein